MPLRSYSTAEMQLTERRRLERPLMGMVWLGVAGFSLAEGTLFYLLMGSVAVGINLLAVHHNKEVFAARRYVNVGVVLATVLLLAELLVKQLAPLIALGHYIILIQLCKLFERKTNRDYVQMVALSLLQITAAGLITDSLWFAAILTVYLVLAIYTTMVFTLKRGLDEVAKRRLYTEVAPPSPDQVAWNVMRDWPRRALLGRLLLTCLVVLVVAVATFLLAPRMRLVAGSALHMDSPGARTGFSDEVRLGRPNRLYESDTAAMHVTVEQGPEAGALPTDARYLRGRIFERYEDNRWRPMRIRSPVRHFPAPTQVLDESVVLEVTLAPGRLPTLFTPYPPVRIEMAEYRPRLGPGLIARVPAERLSGNSVTYRTWSPARPFSDPAREWLRVMNAREVGRYLADVPIRPRVESLALEWTADLRRRRRRAAGATERGRWDLAIARRLSERLGERCDYTLDLSEVDPSADAIEEFLFRTRRGHCEYFASALTVMCRALGVPARLVGGYLMDEYDPVQEAYVVRDRDAHAWVEVYSPGTDWAIVDPTPAAGRTAAADRGWYARFKAFWSDIQFYWYQHVIAYDSSDRSELGFWLLRAASEVWTRLMTLLRRAQEAAVDLLVHGEVTEAIRSLLWVLGGLIVLIGWGVLIRRRRQRRKRRASDRVPGLPEYLSPFLEALSRRGLRRGPAQTFGELADRATCALRLPAAFVAELVWLHHRLRWSGRAAEPGDVARARRRARRLARWLQLQKEQTPAAHRRGAENGPPG